LQKRQSQANSTQFSALFDIMGNANKGQRKNRTKTDAPQATEPLPIPSDPRTIVTRVIMPSTAASMSEVEVEEAEDEGGFWELNGYKIALKRVKNGQKLSGELKEMIVERAKVEEAFGKDLKQWSSKWVHSLKNTSAEYGTTKDGWYAFAALGEEEGDIYMNTREKLMNNPVLEVKQWIEENYPNNLFNINYKLQQFAAEFEEAQMSWKEMNKRVMDAKKKYHESIRVNRPPHEQIEARDRYEMLLRQMDSYKSRYVEKMTNVFEKTQQFELQRMLFFKQIFGECHDLLQTYEDPRYPAAFARLSAELGKMQPKDDLAWWSMNYGTGTQPVWPQLEEP